VRRRLREEAASASAEGRKKSPARRYAGQHSRRTFTAKNAETRTYGVFYLPSLRPLWSIDFWLRLCCGGFLRISCHAIGTATPDAGNSIEMPIHEPFMNHLPIPAGFADQAQSR